jgi:hypothetical protein
MTPATTLSALGATASISPGGGHVPPHVHDDGATLSSAALPSEVVRRIVRESNGAVGTVSDAGSLMSDAGVVACVQRAFGGLAFPEPTGGFSMAVTYSLSFAPS